MEFVVADVMERHIADILQIEKDCFSLPWNRRQLMSQLTDDRHIFIAACSLEDKVLGYVGVDCVLDEGYISNVAVSPEYRKQGVADALLTELLSRAEKRELSFLTLEVRESNIPAISLYSKHGFANVGMRKNYYAKPMENAILMTKFLK